MRYVTHYVLLSLVLARRYVMRYVLLSLLLARRYVTHYVTHYVMHYVPSSWGLSEPLENP